MDGLSELGFEVGQVDGLSELGFVVGHVDGLSELGLVVGHVDGVKDLLGAILGLVVGISLSDGMIELKE